MIKHGFILNTAKTIATGRHPDGTPWDSNPVIWTPTMEPLPFLSPTEATRYLGIHISMDLDWTTQISILHGKIFSFCAQISARRYSPLEGAQIYKSILLPQLEGALRHAIIPPRTIDQWTNAISSSLRKGMALKGLALNIPSHKSSIYTVIRALPLTHLYPIVHLMQTMENLSTPSCILEDYQTHYSSTYDPILRSLQEAPTNRASLLKYSPKDDYFTFITKLFLKNHYILR